MMYFLRFIILLAFSATVAAGTWDESSFGNDDALDWLAECTQSNSSTMISTTLQSALTEQYLEAPTGSAAIAAAEVVAAARGKPNGKLPTELKLWLAKQDAKQIAVLAPAAKKALAKVRNEETSELYQMWAEQNAKKWLASIKELERRLGQ